MPEKPPVASRALRDGTAAPGAVEISELRALSAAAAESNPGRSRAIRAGKRKSKDRQRMTGLSAARFYHVAIGAVMIATIGIACLGVKRASAQADAPDYAALMAAPDRSDGDRQADKRRDPVPFLAFAGLRPGMKVLDMGAGAGYSTPHANAPFCCRRGSDTSTASRVCSPARGSPTTSRCTRIVGRTLQR